MKGFGFWLIPKRECSEFACGEAQIKIMNEKKRKDFGLSVTTECI